MNGDDTSAWGYVDEPPKKAAATTAPTKKAPAGESAWGYVDSSAAPPTSPTMASAEKATQKATGLKAQPKPWSPQWRKEKLFQTEAGTAE